MVIKRVIGRVDSIWKGKKSDPFIVRRWMSEPVIVFIKGKLHWLCTVRFHSPQLHAPAYRTVVINVFTIG